MEEQASQVACSIHRGAIALLESSEVNSCVDDPPVKTLVEELLKNMEDEENQREIAFKIMSVEEVEEYSQINQNADAEVSQITKQHYEKNVETKCTRPNAKVAVPAKKSEDSQEHTGMVENIIENLLIKATSIVNESNADMCKQNIKLTEMCEKISAEKRGISLPNRETCLHANTGIENHRVMSDTEVELVRNEDDVIKDSNDKTNNQVCDFANLLTSGESKTKNEIGSEINVNDGREEQLNRETQIQKDKFSAEMDACDSTCNEETMAEDADDEAKDDNKERKKLSKSKKKKGEKKPNDKDEKNAIHSETQRILRESTVSLPYHHPRQMSLRDFLNRKKNSNNLKITTSTPNEKKCLTNMYPMGSKETSANESGNNIPSDDATCSKTKTATKKFSTLQELKHNLMAVRKSMSQPKISTEPLSLELSSPVGVEQLISRFMKHTSKPSTPATPETCCLNIVSKDTDESGKETLKQEKINVKVTPTAVHNISSGPKISELKSKLRSEISMKKMREREKRLLAYKLDNEEVNEEEAILTDDDDDASIEEGLRNCDGDDSASEDNQMDVSDEEEVEEGLEDGSEEDEESEEDGNEESSDEDDVIHVSKARNKQCLFLDDEAEESGEDLDSCREETDDEVNEKELIKETLSDVVTKNEEHVINNSGISEMQDVQTPKKDADSSFEMMGSLIPAAQPGGGHKFGRNLSTADSDSEEEKTGWLTLEEASQKDIMSQDILEPKSGFNTSWNKEDEDADANDLLLQFCSGRFTQKTSLLDDNKEKTESTTKAEDSSDDDSSFLIGRRRIVKKPELVLCKNIDSEESASEVDFSDAEIEEQEFAGFSSKKKGKILKEFLEQEAELSGSDTGSGDELEADGDDEFEAEGLTEEVLNEEKLRDEIGKVHFKTMLDADKKELRFFQEMYLEDGDLHTEGQGRERKFRWKSIDDSQDSNNDKVSDEEEHEEEEDENWRVKRYEREVWLHEQKVLQVSPSPKKQLALKVKLVNRTVTTSEMPIGNLIKVKEINEKSSSGSFLFRDRKSLSHLAEKYNKVEDDRVGKRATKNFVFTTTSPVKTNKPTMKRSLTTASGPNNIKKLKVAPLRSNSVFNFF